MPPVAARAAEVPHAGAQGQGLQPLPAAGTLQGPSLEGDPLLAQQSRTTLMSFVRICTS